ncbi:LuxR C-terminal-related transcriptional regulator [Nocardioides carbamazepini]|uniref:helix-turn-helix transcriptional regulator n=1 Tax=Nocardioides carbamazepini TaxID=2854259 RepID=UPI00214A2920|nr:response regulator [Nocardioides carbamazepini]MCR1781108.1 LuxR C-terminal-related transcriptional regulator [Nocardioides carbamazepini]
MNRAARGKMRVVLLEDHVLFAESLELALELEGYDALSVSPNAFTSVQALLSRVLRVRPGLVLLDLDLGALGDGRRLIAPLVEAEAQVVVVTGATDRARWGECLALGARRVLPKSGSLNEILATIRRVDQGLPVLADGERASLIDLARQQSRERAEARDRLEQLSRRESEVLGRLLLGETVSEIAAHFVVSDATVRTQVKAILAKLAVSSQIAAVGLANRADWHPPGAD